DRVRRRGMREQAFVDLGVLAHDPLERREPDREYQIDTEDRRDDAKDDLFQEPYDAHGPNSSEENASAARKNLIEGLMRIYNVLGYSDLGLQLVLSAWLPPQSHSARSERAIGFGYLVMSWFLGGVYLSDVMHMGITH